MNRFPCEIIFGEIGLGMNGIEQGASRKYVVIFTGWRSDGVTAKFDFLRLAVSRQPRGRFAVFFLARRQCNMIDLLPVRGIYVTQWIAV